MESELKPKYYQRLEEEIKMICDMGFPGYFLIVGDFIQWSKENDIPVGPGRGSGAGSLVAYALTITNINPLRLIYFLRDLSTLSGYRCQTLISTFVKIDVKRLLSMLRKSMERRESAVITFGKLQAKAVIRDVSRVFSLPYSKQICFQTSSDELGITLDKALEMEPRFNVLMSGDPKIKQIMNIPNA